MIAFVLLGALAVYGFSSDRYSSEADVDDGTLSYSISATGSKTYSVVVSESDIEDMDVLYVYRDGTGSHIEELVKQLKLRGVKDIMECDAEELGRLIADDIGSSEHSNGLMMLSAVLPETIYSDSNDALFQWLDAGGRLYWAGGLLGKYYATSDGIKESSSNYQIRFFGAECLNTGETDMAFSAVDNGYRSALSLLNNFVKYGVNVSALPVESLAIGYEEDGFASVALVKHGKGMICVIGGERTGNQIKDMAQIVASGICPTSKIIDVRTGTASGTLHGSIDLAAHGRVTAFIYLGGYFTVYGMNYSFTV